MKPLSAILLTGLIGAAGLALTGSMMSLYANNSVDVSKPAKNIEHQTASLPGAVTPAALTPSGDDIGTRRIGGAGLVEPASRFVNIGSSVSGIVAQVHVMPGTHVKKGTALFELDTRMAKSKLNQRRSELSVAEAKLQETMSKIPEIEALAVEARAGVAAAKAELADAADLLRRTRMVGTSGGISKRQAKSRKLQVTKTKAKLREAEARHIRAQTQLSRFSNGAGASVIAVQQSLVEQARAAVEAAETELGLHTIRAPISGIALQINVRPGEYAKAGPLPQPLMVVGDTSRLSLRVDVDEADIRHFRSNRQAFAVLRGGSGQRIPLKFARVEPLVMPKQSLTGQAAERVDTRVMQVIYEVAPGRTHILPGQILDVVITGRNSRLAGQ